METDLRYPLHYPIGWPRTRTPERSNFNPKETRSFAQARDELLRQLDLLGATRIILSTNIELRKDGLPYANRSQPSDPGVAVYFRLENKDRVLACDRWDRAIANLWAIAKHIDSMRGQLRWGVGSLDQAFAGYQALPEKSGGFAWWDVLGVSPDAPLAEIKAAYIELAKVAHPDRGGSEDAMAVLNAAMQQAEQLHRK